ncbi:hypothetical protein ACHAP5_004456 [Fusarium lateritium]
MTRSITRDKEKLFLPPGGLDFGSKEHKSGVVHIYLKAGENTPGTGLHWHETHTEYLEIVQGFALVTLGNHTSVFSKDDGIITIPRYSIHQYMRADKTEQGKVGKDVDLIVREWTEPGDGDKEVFFRNLISLMMDKKDTTLGTVDMLLSVMVLIEVSTKARAAQEATHKAGTQSVEAQFRNEPRDQNPQSSSI